MSAHPCFAPLSWRRLGCGASRLELLAGGALLTLEHHEGWAGEPGIAVWLVAGRTVLIVRAAQA